MQNRMNEVFSAMLDEIIIAYSKYKHFYDRKANTSPLTKHRDCLHQNPKLSNINNHLGKSLAKWLPLYRVEQVLLKSNYTVRNIGTNNTQCVHRISFIPVNPRYQVEDLTQIRQNNYVPDSAKVGIVSFFLPYFT